MACSETSMTPFGSPMRKHFLFDQNFLNLNHGSFGTYPSTVQTTLRQFQDKVEARPDPFIRYSTPKVLDESREAVANLLSIPRNECVLIKNATTGVNTILHNLPFGPDDVIVYFDTIYGALEKAIVSYGESRSVQARKVNYQFPISHEELAKRFTDVVKKARSDGLNVKVALFDVISSLPAVRFPFERLIETCREEGILSLVDGAHGIGQLPLDLGALRPDFFVSNCHKWLFVPRSCCVLHVPQRNQHLIRTTLPTSWGFIPSPDSPETAPSVIQSDDPSKTAFESLFEFVATNDDTPYFCIPAALKFRREICGGEDRIYRYLETLANEAVEIVAMKLGTEALQEPHLNQEERSQFRRCAMTNVRLPISTKKDLVLDQSLCSTVEPDDIGPTIRFFQTTLVQRYGTFVPVFAHGGWLWVRLSAQVYLEKKDFEWLGGVLKELCAEFAKERRS